MSRTDGNRVRFDFVSFLIGFFTASVLFGLAYRYRERLYSLRDRTASSLKGAQERLTSGADQRYRQDVINLWQSAHLAGSLIALDDILIQPRFWVDAPPFVPGRDEDTDITHVVPATADFPELAGVYQAPGPTPRDLARASNNVVILGKPGTGKTIALTYIGLRAAALDADYFPTPLLPVMVHAGDLELPLAEKTDVAQPLIDAATAKLSAITAPAFPGFCRSALKKGEALILLDGLEDLPPAHQALVIEWLKNFMTTYHHNRIIATAMINGYAPLLSLDFAPAVIGGWSWADYRSLVDKWVEAWERMLTARRRRPKEQIDPALVEGWLSGGSVGRTPLEVTLKIWTGLAGDAEGPRPVDWIETYVKRFARAPEGRRAFEKCAGQLLSHDRYGLQREKLVGLINTARSEVSSPSNADPEDIVDSLAGRGGMLAKRAGGRYSFSHPVVCAYLAAKHSAVSETPEAVSAVQEQPTWATALRFYAALANASAIVAQRLSTPPDAMQSDLFMVASWLGDAPPNAPWRADIFRRLAQLFINTNMPVHLRARALCALVATRDENVTKLLKQSLASSDPAARQYSAAVLGAIGDNTSVPELTKLLFTDEDLYVRWAAALALALVGDQNSVEALGRALLEGNEGIRRALCEALSLHPTDGHDMLKEAIADQDVVIRRWAIAGLLRVGNQPWVLELLDKAFVEDSQWIVRSAAEAAAKDLRTPPDRSPKPLPPIDQTGWLIAYAAGKGRGVPTGRAARTTMLDALKENDDVLRMAAADHLGRIAATDAIPLLTAAARASSPNLREVAYKALVTVAMATGQKVAI
ncbi:MAG TPA: HEAT repeat domain-containing protein [Anaerolineales bacterium]|nr:HEAT repeat domain-containing protein [Anaerolineales bacterium]